MGLTEKNMVPKKYTYSNYNKGNPYLIHQWNTYFIIIKNFNVNVKIV